MKTVTVVLFAILSLALSSSASGGEQAAASLESPAVAPSSEIDPDRPNPMLGFSRLVDGSWKIGPLQHVFEWGIARSSVICRSYDAEGKLASEARWFWHPGENAIKGYSVDATGAFFAEMTTSFDGDMLINELTTIGADGARADYTGKWKFTGNDSYDWTLYNRTDDGLVKAMSMTATRTFAQ